VIVVRRLAPGDEQVVAELAELEPPDAEALLRDERTLYVAALDDGRPVGFVFAHELLRRHGEGSMLFVYDLGVEEEYRRRGIARRLLRELAAIAGARGIRIGFVITNASNEPAMALYESVGGVRPNDDDVMWDFGYEAR
jgi:ribosomal protein S18 acetylase RimI-like enzyme